MTNQQEESGHGLSIENWLYGHAIGSYLTACDNAGNVKGVISVLFPGGKFKFYHVTREGKQLGGDELDKISETADRLMRVSKGAIEDISALDFAKVPEMVEDWHASGSRPDIYWQPGTPTKLPGF